MFEVVSYHMNKDGMWNIYYYIKERTKSHKEELLRNYLQLGLINANISLLGQNQIANFCLPN